MPSQDVWKFTPVSYRTSALWGRCPALTSIFQLITPSRASGTADHVRSLDDLFIIYGFDEKRKRQKFTRLAATSERVGRDSENKEMVCKKTMNVVKMKSNETWKQHNANGLCLMIFPSKMKNLIWRIDQPMQLAKQHDSLSHCVDIPNPWRPWYLDFNDAKILDIDPKISGKKFFSGSLMLFGIFNRSHNNWIFQRYVHSFCLEEQNRRLPIQISLMSLWPASTW